MENNGAYEIQSRIPAYCLGQPAHQLRPDEVICSVCGTLANGALIGVYQVRQLLGTGRSGHAYLAIHQRSGQPAVLKLFPADSSMPLWEAARREVRITTALRHHAILAFYSCSTWSPGQQTLTGGTLETPQQSGTYLLSLCQYIPGNFTGFITHYQKRETQQALQQRGMTAGALLVSLMQQIASALNAVHARGIAHGALIPGNVFFNSQERVWISDFGLARLHPPSPPYLPPELYGAAQTSMYTPNVRAYWNAVNPASDQYMLAMLCQQLFSQILRPHEYGPLQHALQRATSQRPERRYPSIDLFINDLMTLTGNTGHSLQGTQVRQGAEKRDYAYAVASSSPAHILIPETTGNEQPVTPRPQGDPGQFTPAVSLTPITPGVHLTPEDWERRGDKLFTLREYEEALKAYHRAVEVNQEKAQTWLALGDTYFALERYQEALMAYEQAMYINPNDPQAWASRGTVLDALGRHRDAIDAYERSDQLRQTV